MEPNFKFLGNIDPDKHMLVDITYNKSLEGTKDDVLYVVYKNKETGEKKLKTIKNPKMYYYITKEKYRDFDHFKDYSPLDEVDRYECRAKDIAFDLAKNAGADYERYLRESIQTRQFANIGKIHKMYNYAFGSDIQIETWYKIQYQLNYPSKDEVYPITCMFLDIEVDGYHVEGFPTADRCPVNMCTIVDKDSSSVHTLLLRNSENPLIQKFEEDIDEFKKQLHDQFDESYGELSYNIYMYDDEVELITDIFKMIHTFKRDFVFIWNMRFDIPYLIDRLECLGVNSDNVVCHPDFNHNFKYFVRDDRASFVKERVDRFVCNSYTRYLDQMIVYAGLRGSLRSNNLNAVAKAELGDTKLDYTDIGNIKTLPYMDYALSVMYNIKD